MTDPHSPQDPLQTLRAHLRDAQQAAQELIQQARETPSQGWESIDSEDSEDVRSQLESLLNGMRSLRELLPEDLLEQLQELLRQLLAVIQALLEILQSRLERHEPSQGEQIQDIPIV